MNFHFLTLLSMVFGFINAKRGSSPGKMFTEIVFLPSAPLLPMLVFPGDRMPSRGNPGGLQTPGKSASRRCRGRKKSHGCNYFFVTGETQHSSRHDNRQSGKKKKKRKPHCGRGRRKGQDCERDDNCRRHPNGPSCRNVDQAIAKAYEQISWLSSLRRKKDGFVIPDISHFGHKPRKRQYQLATGVANVSNQECMTPPGQLGRCKYLQHCILPEFADSFDTFLRYFCVIRGRYIGVCCPQNVPMTTFPLTPVTSTIQTPLQPPKRNNNRGCGENSIQQEKIVGGIPSVKYKHPWMVALLVDSSPHCGGVLISQRHVLTAAHCIQGYNPRSMTVRLGEYTFHQSNETKHKDYSVSRVKIHERFDKVKFFNDIAVVTLSQSAILNEEIWPVCLPPINDQFVGSTATALGWGALYYGGPLSNVLREVSMPVWDNQDCDEAHTPEIFPNNICAGKKSGGADSCQGDSGGPLLIEWGPLTPRRWIVAGIVSWGRRCARPNKPGVYTRVNKFLHWIRMNMM